MPIDWTEAFQNAAYIPDGDAYLERWDHAARAFREGQANATYDLKYGAEPRELFDLFRPSGPPRGLFIFIHGGYWMMLDKNAWSHIAQGALARGFAVAVPSYPLCPQARIHEITRSARAAVLAAAEEVDGPIYIAGHSAGGHLAARMACCDVPLPEALRARLAHIVSISGLHDLRPLCLAQMNETLQISEGEARTESPALLAPCAEARVSFYVGAQERPEFLRQTRLASEAWSGHCTVKDIYEPDQNHFSVLESLSREDGALTRAIFEPAFSAK